MFSLVALAAALAAAVPAGPVEAAPFTVVEGLGSDAVLVNPAWLGFQPGLAWGFTSSGGREGALGQFTMSSRLFDRVTPALVVGGFGQRSLPGFAATRRVGARLGGGVGLALGPLVAAGVAGEGLVGHPDAPFDGAGRVLVGLALRPSPWLALGLRPLGRWLELDAGLTARAGAGALAWLAKLQVSLGPGVALAPFVAGLGARELRWGAWLGVRLERLAVLAAGSAGSDLQEPAAHLWLSGAEHPQQPRLRRGGRTLVARLSDPALAGPGGAVRLQVALRDALRQPGVARLAFRGGEIPWPLTDTLEVAGLLRQARGRGLPVSFYLDGGNAKTLLLAAAGDDLALHPGAVFEVTGVRLTGLYVAELLESLGVRAEFVTIGRYKTAPETFTRREASVDARTEHEGWVRTLDALVAERWSPGLGPVDAVRGQGLLAAEALVPRLAGARAVPFPAWWEGLGRVEELPLAPPADDGAWGRCPAVAVLPIEGWLTGGESARLPVFGLRLAGVVDVARALQQAADDPAVKAIVLRVDSGGGSAQAAEELHAWIVQARKKKPVWVSISGLCASGCLYLAAAADHIVAERGALIGSIGIFAGKVDLSGLLGRLGVAVQEFGDDALGRGTFALTRAFSEGERATLHAALEAGYRLFKRHVAEHGAVPRLDEIADGRLVETAEARALGLIDDIAGLPELLQRLDEVHGTRLALRLPEPPGLLERLERLQRLLATLSTWQVYHLGPLVAGP